MGLMLAGDVGGTKTELVVFSREEGPQRPLKRGSLPSRSFPNLEALVAHFLAAEKVTLERACFGVAGPVMGGRVRVTNLPWVIEVQRLQAALAGAKVCLINDLEATALSLPHLKAQDLHVLNAGQPTPHGPWAVIAPGTGLGEAFLTREGGRYRAHPSEGGHCDFAPQDELQLGLWRFVRRRYEHVSYERVCSGMALSDLYAYLKESGEEEPAWLGEQLARAEDSTPVIVKAGLSQPPCPPCRQALELLVNILAAEAGNLALKLLARGGVYLGGGLAPRLLSLLKSKSCWEAFCRKGRFSALMSRLPLSVILTPHAALWGAVAYALEAEKGPPTAGPRLRGASEDPGDQRGLPPAGPKRYADLQGGDMA